MAQTSLPLFASAPRVSINLGPVQIAFAIGINFNLNVDVQPVFAMGQYDAVALEPVYYNPVTGTIQIIRLADTKNIAATAANSDASGLNIDNAISRGVSMPPITIQAIDSTVTSSNTVLGAADLRKHLDPASVLTSSLLDMDIYLNCPVGNSSTTGATTTQLVKWFTIYQCRLTSRNVNITMGQIVNEPVSFQGLMVLPEGVSSFKLDSKITDTTI